jgi:hypothetical protein
MLEAPRELIRPSGLLIAAHACATGATLVTANTDEFKRIRGLTVENWLATAKPTENLRKNVNLQAHSLRQAGRGNIL